jgi:DNA-binding transcriptional LysR family regulator
MDLKYLRTFQVVTRLGSFQKAAQALSYAPSTVTFQMKQLEKELGVPLFERRGHQQQLSSVGVAIQPYIENVLTASDKLQSFCQADTLSGSLTVLLPESLLTYHLQSILEEFRRKAPSVRLNLQVENCFSIYNKMRLGQADVALHYGVGNYPSSFFVRSLRSYPLVLVASPKLSEQDSDFITPNQTKPLCLLLNDARALYLTFFHSYLREKSITLAQEMDVWSLEAIKQCILSNIGIAFLPEFVVHKELQEGIMKQIPVEMEQTEMTAILVRRKKEGNNPVIRCFEDIVQAHFAADEDSQLSE